MKKFFETEGGAQVLISGLRKKFYIFERVTTHAFLALTVILAGCGGGGGSGTSPNNPNPSIQTWNISGVIKHYQTSAALPGVTVTLSTSSGTVSTMTDASGAYHFSGIANGSYNVTPALNGYAFFPPVNTVTVNGVDAGNTDFTYTDKAGKIVGLIADSGGIPYSPVNIDIYQGTNLFSRQTNENDGSFSISLPPGTYSLKASKQNFVTLTYDNIVVTENQNSYLEMMFLIHTSLSGLGDVSGRINNALTGTGVNNLTVRLRQGINVTSGPVVAATTTFNDGSPTDPEADGAYTFMNPLTGAFTIPGGNYTAEVFGPGFTPVFFSVKCLGGMITPNQNMTVAPDAATDLVRIVLTWFTKGDLDSHLTGPTAGADRFHIFYADKTYSDTATTDILDVDNTVAYGPETTTLALRTAGVYRFSVHDYTNLASTTSSALSMSGAQVRVYKGSTLMQTFNVPVGRPGTLWTVFELDGATAALTPINRMSFHADPGTIQ